MLKKNINDVAAETVTMEGVEGTTIQWLFGRDGEMPSFAMRRFVMKPGGKIPLHDHPWEHEIYFLQGEARVFSDRETTTVGAGEALYVPPDEPHGYENTGDGDLVFLCMVPNSAVK